MTLQHLIKVIASSTAGVETHSVITGT